MFIYKITNIINNKICKNNSLNYGSMIRVTHGFQENYKNWKVKRNVDI